MANQTSKKLAELRAMTEADLVAYYDSLAENRVETQVTVAGELARRDQERQNAEMTRLTQEMHRFTKQMRNMTVVVTVATIVAVVVSLIALAK